jgi:hypothetical protein
VDLAVEISEKSGKMEYTTSASVTNGTNEVFSRFEIQLVDSQGAPIGKTNFDGILFPGDSEAGPSKWSGGQYRVEWDADPTIKAAQLETFESVRKEKSDALVGAKCILGSATKR